MRITTALSVSLLHRPFGRNDQTTQQYQQSQPSGTSQQRPPNPFDTSPALIHRQTTYREKQQQNQGDPYTATQLASTGNTSSQSQRRESSPTTPGSDALSLESHRQLQQQQQQNDALFPPIFEGSDTCSPIQEQKADYRNRTHQRVGEGNQQHRQRTGPGDVDDGSNRQPRQRDGQQKESFNKRD